MHGLKKENCYHFNRAIIELSASLNKKSHIVIQIYKEAN